MAVKYSIPFFDDFNQEWQADIDLPDYVGAPVELTGVGRVFCQPEWSAGGDPYEPIVNSKVTVQFYNKGGEVNVQELQLLPDMTGRLILYRGADLWWTGYINPDGIQRMLQPMPYPITITATDGLAMLKDVPFSLGNNWPMPAGVSNRSPMSFIRYILYGFPSSPHLGITLPIRFQCDIENVEYSDSAIMGTISWGALGEAWTDFNGNSRTCMYILEGMLRAHQCRLMQFGGKWHIQRINDVVGGAYTWTELGTETGTAPTVTTGVTDMVAGISPTFYPMVNENQVATMKAAYTDVVATYEHYQAENVLPNGGFDIGSSGVNWLNWAIFNNPGGNGSISDYESLRPDGTGLSVDLTNALPEATASARFYLVGGLPIDANLLFKRFTWGFTFLPLNGFPFILNENNENEAENGDIVWDDYPLRVRIMYDALDNVGDTSTLLLNRWGFWDRSEPVGGYLKFESVELEPGQDFAVATYSGVPLKGDTLTVWWKHVGAGGYPQVSWLHVVDQSTEGDLAATLAAFAATIPTASSTATTIRFPVPDFGELWYRQASATSGAYNLLPGGWIDISVPKMKIGDVASVVFQGKGGNSEILFPDPGVLPNIDTAVGKIQIEFALLAGQRYVLDDVFVRVEENNDVYQSRIQDASKRSNRKTVDLNISSSFSGFMLSNLMTSYDKSNTEFRFTDGKYTGSLTGMTANAMMRYHHLPREIFEGDIYTNGRDWQFNHIYLFDGKKYLPLVSRYNIETGVVTLTAIEGADDENEFVEEHYGSNELILSNT